MIKKIQQLISSLFEQNKVHDFYICDTISRIIRFFYLVAEISAL